MTIRMLQAWNGLHQQKIVTTLSGGDEAALVAAGIATYDLDGPAENLRMAHLVKDGGVPRLSDGAVIVPGAAVVVANFSPVVRSSVGDATDTNFVTLATFSVPGGLLGPNGWLEIFFNATSNSNALTKYFTVDIGGNNVAAPAVSPSQVSLGWGNYVFNTASELSQKCGNMGSSPFGPSANTNINLSVDTRANFNVVIKAKWSAQAAPAGADTITLNGCYIKAHYAP